MTLVGCGVTLHECVTAADELSGEGINVRVVDPFTLKPMDAELLNKCADVTQGRFITVEDHYPEGGIGDAVALALSGRPGVVVERIAVRKIPGSGPGAVIMNDVGITAPHICKAVKKLLA